jgi:hypothetical protein
MAIRVAIAGISFCPPAIAIENNANMVRGLSEI